MKACLEKKVLEEYISEKLLVVFRNKCYKKDVNKLMTFVFSMVNMYFKIR